MAPAAKTYRTHLAVVALTLLLGFLSLGRYLTQLPQEGVDDTSQAPLSAAELAAVNGLDTGRASDLSTLRFPQIPSFLRDNGDWKYPDVAADAAAGMSGSALLETNRAQAAAPSVYRVKKGDTLFSIAEQALGSRAQADALFQANRDLLSDPNKLEVGMILTMPGSKDNGPVQVSSTGTYHTVADGESLTTVCARYYYGKTAPVYKRIVLTANPSCLDANGGLIPGVKLFLPDAPDNLDDGGNAASARLYRVRPGDTLTSISLRFYGTTGEWKRIHEANQDRIPNPNTLETNLELTIPPQGR